MKDLLHFLIKLGVTLGAFFGGGWLAVLGMDYQNHYLFWGGLIIALFGILYFVWLAITNGVSLWND